MQTQEIVSNLNKALQLEYSDVFLYSREAELIKDKDKVISLLFEQFGLMEVRHADLLARRIFQLGGKPAWDFYLLQNKNDLKDILNWHIDYETKAVDFYGRLVEQVDEETKILLRGIRAEEEVHRDKIKELLSQKGAY